MPRIGIDLGGTKTEGAVMDESGDIVIRRRVPTPVENGYTAVLKAVTDLVLELEQSTGRRCTLGICTPGSVSTVTGGLKNSNTTALNGRPVVRDLQRELRREVRIENDANCFALSEALQGAARGFEVVFGVIMGTGVGGGIVVNRNLLTGRQHIAGEWGHNVLEADGDDCYCGKSGCVETFLSGPGLINQWRRNDPRVSAQAEITELLKMAEDQEPLALKTLEQLVDRFGKALSVIVNILDPDAIVLGGGLSNLDILYEKGPEALRRYVFNDELRTPILRNEHGDSSGVRGAAQLWPPTP